MPKKKKTYVRTISTDAAQVQADEIKVGLDILHNDPTGLAQDAQTAHDDFANLKTDIIAAGANVADNSRLGNAEYQMDNAMNELKNGMGALVAFAENPNAGTLGSANSKLGQGHNGLGSSRNSPLDDGRSRQRDPNLAGSGPGYHKTRTQQRHRRRRRTPPVRLSRPGSRPPGTDVLRGRSCRRHCPTASLRRMGTMAASDRPLASAVRQSLPATRRTFPKQRPPLRLRRPRVLPLLSLRIRPVPTRRSSQEGKRK